jgi:hypothetical protein
MLLVESTCGAKVSQLALLRKEGAEAHANQRPEHHGEQKSDQARLLGNHSAGGIRLLRVWNPLL